MFAVQIRQLYSTAGKYSFDFESTFVRLSSGHYFCAERQPHPNRGTAHG